MDETRKSGRVTIPTTETDSDSTAEEAVVSAFAPHPDARSIAPQSTTPIIL